MAARWLRRRGHRVLARNLVIGRYELDLLVESPDGRCVIIVEVKTGHAGVCELAERMRPAQQRRLQWLADRLHGSGLVGGRSMRIDLVLVRLDRPRGKRVRHLEGAFGEK